jgi:hypothetical protein
MADNGVEEHRKETGASPVSEREFTVTIKMTREYEATIKVQATDQAEADRRALALFDRHARPEGLQCDGLGLPPPWTEYEPRTRAPKIDTSSRCADCGKETIVLRYFMVSNEVWAATGLARNGKLCLDCLKKRIGRPLNTDDFRPVVLIRRRLAAPRKEPSALE